jgi:hypothetical protein
MQHWHIFHKWSARMFKEAYLAYVQDRSSFNPGETWYKEELHRFDACVIPTALRLRDCGAFGVHSNEFLECAMMNRTEWFNKGEVYVSEMATSASNANTGN